MSPTSPCINVQRAYGHYQEVTVLSFPFMETDCPTEICQWHYVSNFTNTVIVIHTVHQQQEKSTIINSAMSEHIFVCLMSRCVTTNKTGIHTFVVFL